MIPQPRYFPCYASLLSCSASDVTPIIPSPLHSGPLHLAIVDRDASSTPTTSSATSHIPPCTPVHSLEDVGEPTLLGRTLRAGCWCSTPLSHNLTTSHSASSGEFGKKIEGHMFLSPWCSPHRICTTFFFTSTRIVLYIQLPTGTLRKYIFGFLAPIQRFSEILSFRELVTCRFARRCVPPRIR
jgi:hypothetical protein